MFSSELAVEYSTLQRLEQGDAEPTLATAFKICRGLRITPSQMVDEISQDEIGSGIPNQFEEKGEKRIAHIELSRDELSRNDILSFVKKDDLAQKIALTMIDSVIKHGIDGGSSDFAYHLTWLSQTRLFEFPLFTSKLVYPDEITLKDIERIYAQGGALALQEVGRIIEARRNQQFGKLKDFSRKLKDFNRSYKNGILKVSGSMSTQSRVEAGEVANIKLSYVMAIDTILGKDHDIVKMYWNAPGLVDKRGRLPRLPGFWIELDVDFYLIMGRWLRIFYDNDSFWIERLRSEVRDFNATTQKPWSRS